jgi:hypothetical protein
VTSFKHLRRARLREAFGDTMSDEFVDFMLGKLVEVLRHLFVASATFDQPYMTVVRAVLRGSRWRSLASPSLLAHPKSVSGCHGNCILSSGEWWRSRIRHGP